VLSEHLQELMQGRRLLSAVFLTYQFEPGFFEQEIVPILIDLPVSHASKIRVVQLEDALRDLPAEIAVYYDANGLLSGDAGSAKLDIRRIPVRHRTGIFHPKNLFLLVEDEEAGADGARARALIVGCLSANLTRSGWWENVEACHFETLAEDDRSRITGSLTSFLESLRRKTAAESRDTAMLDILGFLRATIPMQHKSGSGRLRPHFYSGTESLTDFLEMTAGEFLHDTYLEVISPYFDDAPSSGPLESLIRTFNPKEVRVFLPRSAAGAALCRSELYDFVSEQPSVSWGRFPKERLKLGRGEDTGERRVHAKLYRFFTQNPKREICFVGSANLTSPAHNIGGNVETGFLVDVELTHRPEFWLTVDSRRPNDFESRTEGDGVAASGGTRLSLKYTWDKGIAEAFWDASAPSSSLRIEARGIPIGVVPPLPSREWVLLLPDFGVRVREALLETSLFSVYIDADEPGLLLVQEEAMSHKPSLLFSLTAAEILKYWSLLTQQQKTAFLESHAPASALLGQGEDLVFRTRMSLTRDTVFDRFAAAFHAFGCMERAVRSALEEGRDKQASYRLFGRKYDSLGHLLDRVGSESGAEKDVDNYVILLCARQACQEIARDYPEYWSDHRDDVETLNSQLESLKAIRQRLSDANTGDFGEFLGWFDRWFLQRAAPPVVQK
jgi:hypothetical protein